MWRRSQHIQGRAPLVAGIDSLLSAVRRSRATSSSYTSLPWSPSRNLGWNLRRDCPCVLSTFYCSTSCHTSNFKNSPSKSFIRDPSFRWIPRVPIYPFRISYKIDSLLVLLAKYHLSKCVFRHDRDKTKTFESIEVAWEGTTRSAVCGSRWCHWTHSVFKVGQGSRFCVL